MDAIFDFVSNFVDVQYGDIPKTVVDAAKKEVLDTLGVTLAGSSKPGVKELIEVVKEWGGRRQGTIIGYGLKVPTPNAAQVNATMGHALDYDDAHEGAMVHPGVITVPTAFTMAELTGRLSGKEFITAVTLGTDFICRLGLAVSSCTNPMKTGWHPTTLYGFLCAAAVAGRIVGLDKNRMTNALGIAYHQCSGNGQCVIDGALTKRMGPGFAVNGGITATLMAEKGMTGANNCLEGEIGLFKQYHRGNYNAKVLTADLGKKFEGMNVSIKPYPCCRGTHPSIDAALALVNEYNVKAKDIDKVTVFTGEASYSLLCSPLELKRKPRNIVDSQFSIPWAVAVALAKHRVSIEDFTEEAVKSDSILEISTKVDAELDRSLSRLSPLEPARINIRLRSEKVYTTQYDSALGSPERPMTLNDCIKKYKDCSAYSINPVSNNAIGRTVELVKHLEELTDVTEIVRTIS